MLGDQEAKQKAKSQLPYLVTALCLWVSFAVALFASPDPVHSDDGLRHITIAQQFWSEGIHTWQRYFFAGFFADRNFNPWFLSDLSYMPFAWGDLVLGLKSATLAHVGILLLIFILLLRRLQIEPLLGSILLLLLVWGSDMYTWRLMLGRPFTLGVSVFLLLLWAILCRRYWMVTALTAVSVCLSHLFLFTLPLLCLGGVWLLAERKTPIKSAVLLFTASIFGLLLGFALHPQGSEYFKYLAGTFVSIPFSKNLDLGGEFASGLYQPDAAVLFGISVLGISLIGLHSKLQGPPWDWAFLLSLVAVFTLGYASWMRSIDYLWPLFLLASGRLLAITDKQKAVEAGLFHWRIWGIRPVWIISTVCLVHFGLKVQTTLINSVEYPLSEFDQLRQVPTGARILNVDWDLFPPLMFFRPDLRYARGMDPTLDVKDNVTKWKLLDTINDRWDLRKEDQSWSEFFKTLQERTDMSNFRMIWAREADNYNRDLWLAEVYRAYEPDYIVVSKRYPKLAAYLEKAPGLKLIAQSPRLSVYQILNGESAN